MNKPKAFDRSKYIDALMKLKFRRLLQWQKPTIYQTIGPYFPEAFDDFSNTLEETIQFVLRFYEEKEDGLLALMNRPNALDYPGAQQALKFFNEEIKSLSSQEPVWFASGFGVVEMEADYDYWLKMKSWSLSEATTLSLGFEPTNEVSDAAAKGSCDPSIVQYFERRHRLIENSHYPYGENTMFHPKVEVLVNWLITENIPIPLRLIDAFSAYIDEKIQVLSLPSTVVALPGKIDPREHMSLQKLVIAMAIKGYGYDPDASKSQATSDIMSDMQLLGLGIDPDTIRKHLRKSATLLPPDWKDE